MSKKVAFLRGINVGGRTIRMAELKECLDNAGFSGAVTLLQTGNVIFESADDLAIIRTNMEAAVSKQFGYDAKIFVYEVDTVLKIVEDYPFDSSDNTKQHYVVFADAELPQELVDAPRDESIEEISVSEGVIYWTVEKGKTLKSPFASELNKSAHKGRFTSRNLNTLRKIP